MENAVAAFAVRFDTLHGNMLEWIYPESLRGQVAGLEYKAICSGQHHVEDDFIYFRQDSFYGVSAFHKLVTDDVQERGVRMRSVGVLVQDSTSLPLFRIGLLSAARSANEANGMECYEDLKRIVDTTTYDLQRAPAHPSLSSRGSGDGAHAAALKTKSRYFGVGAWTLWKAAMLGKRILFYGPAPAGEMVERTRWLAESVKGFVDVEVLYSVNVMDIPVLESLPSYIACTTECVFERKSHLYDVYVCLQHVELSHELARVLHGRKTDEKRLHAFLQAVQGVRLPDERDAILRTRSQDYGQLLCAACRDIAQARGFIDKESLRALELHGSDADFLKALASRLGYSLPRRVGIRDSSMACLAFLCCWCRGTRARADRLERFS